MRVLNYLDDWLILAQSRDTPASHIDKLLRHLEFLRLCVNMRKSILAPSQSNVSGSVLRLKAVETRARPPVCLPCAFSNWTVYYTCARCSFGWNLESLGRRGLRAVCASWSPAAASKLWGHAAKVSSAGGSPGLGDVTCRGHDWRINWGRWAVCEGMLTLGLWSEPQSRWHINRLELEAVFLALRIFGRSWNCGMYWFAPTTCLWFRT